MSANAGQPRAPGAECATWWQRHRLHLLIFGVALAVYAATSADRLVEQSDAPHFVYLADALLHGQAQLRVPPLNNNDWIHHRGEWHVSFPPVPAVFMMPWVALFGRDFNDVLFTLPWAALNVLLMFLVLELLGREGLSPLGRRGHLWLTGLFGFGTLHYCCSVLGEVWFTAQVMGVSFSLAYILAGYRARHPLLAGLFLALAFDTRVNLAFSVGYFLLQLVLPRLADGRPAAGSWRRAAAKLALFAAPVLVLGAAQMAFNHVRFGNVFEFGHALLSGPAGSRIAEHGLFAYHYLEWNLRALLLRLPTLLDQPPYIGYNPDGLSIFLTTPVFVRLFWPRAKPWLYPILWAAAVPALLPALFYQNSGYVQFGYRFSLDITPYLIMLLAVGRVPMNRWTKLLILASVAVNLAGAIAFKRNGPV